MGRADVTREVTSADGVRLAVYESGPPGAPVIVAVHGYPDDHSVWDELTPLLADRFRVVTYDVRGAGASDHPRRVADYRLPKLVADLAAVIDAVSPDAPVHLLGHDWGSVQSWPAVTDESLRGRIARFTSISGPSITYGGAWLRGRSRGAARQLAHSYYVALFQIPKLPELAIRSGLLDRLVQDGRPRRRSDELNGLQLYRANRRAAAEAPRPVEIPVQLVVPGRDPYVTPAFAIGAARPWVADLRVDRIDAGHWVVTEQPEAIADLVRSFAG